MGIVDHHDGRKQWENRDYLSRRILLNLTFSHLILILSVLFSSTYSISEAVIPATVACSTRKATSLSLQPQSIASFFIRGVANSKLRIQNGYAIQTQRYLRPVPLPSCEAPSHNGTWHSLHIKRPRVHCPSLRNSRQKGTSSCFRSSHLKVPEHASIQESQKASPGGGRGRDRHFARRLGLTSLYCCYREKLYQFGI